MPSVTLAVRNFNERSRDGAGRHFSPLTPITDAAENKSIASGRIMLPDDTSCCEWGSFLCSLQDLRYRGRNKAREAAGVHKCGVALSRFKGSND